MPVHNATTVIAPSIAAMLNCHRLNGFFCISWPFMPPLYCRLVRLALSRKESPPMPRPRSELDTSTYAARTAAHLAELRQRHGYGMEELREALADLGVVASTSTLYAYERGREAGGADIPLDLAYAIARVYRLPSVREVFPKS
jgi:hypothetical protein